MFTLEEKYEIFVAKFYDHIRETILDKKHNKLYLKSLNFNVYSRRKPCRTCEACLIDKWKTIFDKIIEVINVKFGWINENPKENPKLCLNKDFISHIYVYYSINGNEDNLVSKSNTNQVSRMDQQFILWYYSKENIGHYSIFTSVPSLHEHANDIEKLKNAKVFEKNEIISLEEKKK